MARIRSRILFRSVLLPAAVLLAVSTAAPAFAGTPAAQQPSYTMRLRPASVTVSPGASATTAISNVRFYSLPSARYAGTTRLAPTTSASEHQARATGRHCAV